MWVFFCSNLSNGGLYSKELSRAETVTLEDDNDQFHADEKWKEMS